MTEPELKQQVFSAAQIVFPKDCQEHKLLRFAFVYGAQFVAPLAEDIGYQNGLEAGNKNGINSVISWLRKGSTEMSSFSHLARLVERKFLEQKNER